MSAANRRRGHDCERTVARWLRDNGFPDACTTRAKLGHDGATAPGDVDFHPLVVLEVKDVKGSAWPTWCRQAWAESPNGTVPAVVRRDRGVTNPGAWEVRYHWGSWRRHVTDDMAATPCIDLPRREVRLPGGYTSWYVTTLADLVAAVRALDAPSPPDVAEAVQR